MIDNDSQVQSSEKVGLFCKILFDYVIKGLPGPWLNIMLHIIINQVHSAPPQVFLKSLIIEHLETPSSSDEEFSIIPRQTFGKFLEKVRLHDGILAAIFFHEIFNVWFQI
jgi:hypothetical protein